MSGPRLSRMRVDATILRQGFSALMADTRETLKRYTPEQIARSKILTARQKRLAFYEKCLHDFDFAATNNQRKKKRKTYMLGVCCTRCGYLARITQKWLDVAMPTCPDKSCGGFGEEMEMLGETARSEISDVEAAETLEEMRQMHEQEKAEEKNIGTALDFIRPDDTFSG